MHISLASDERCHSTQSSDIYALAVDLVLPCFVGQFYIISENIASQTTGVVYATTKVLDQVKHRHRTEMQDHE